MYSNVFVYYTRLLVGDQNCICLAFKPVYDNFSVVSLYIFDEIYILLESPFMLSELNKGLCPYNNINYRRNTHKANLLFLLALQLENYLQYSDDITIKQNFRGSQ